MHSVVGGRMLNGRDYFGSFSDEESSAFHDREKRAEFRVKPELLAALAELERDLQAFLATNAQHAGTRGSPSDG
jgi:hypothetical protein